MSDMGPFPTRPGSNPDTGWQPSGQGEQHPGTTPPAGQEDWIAAFSDTVEKGLSTLCASRLKAFLALMLFALVCFMPGFNTIPPVDRDEARFAQASKQMMESGDYIDIRFQDDTRYKKPVGIYWLQIASAKLTGQGEDAPIWVYRIPSLAGAILSVGLTFLIGMRMASVRAGFLAGLAMAASILLGVEARLAKTDAMLLATILAAQWAVWELYDIRAGLSRAKSLLLWGALGAGVLIKGPIILMVSGLTILVLSVLERSISWLKGTGWKVGLPLFLLITLPWFIAIGIHTDWGFYIESVGKDMLGKVVEGKESHGAPPGTYLAATIATFWPASVFFILSVVWIWRERGQKSVRYALAWILPSWVIFEFVPTKLPHYILPMLPAMAILTMQALENKAASWRPLWGRIVALLIPLFATILGLGAPIALLVLQGTLNPAALGLGLVAFALGLLAYAMLIKGRVMASFIMSAIIGLVLYLSLHGTIFPSFTKAWLSNRLVEAAEKVKPCEGTELASVGYSEPSLVFLGGTDTLMTTPETAAHFIIESGCRLAMVENRSQPEFFKSLGSDRDKIEQVATVEGYKLNGGKWLTFGLYRLKMD